MLFNSSRNRFTISSNSTVVVLPDIYQKEKEIKEIIKVQPLGWKGNLHESESPDFSPNAKLSQVEERDEWNIAKTVKELK